MLAATAKSAHRNGTRIPTCSRSVSGRRRFRATKETVRAARSGGCSNHAPSSASRSIACPQSLEPDQLILVTVKGLVEALALESAQNAFDHLFGVHGFIHPRCALPTSPSAGVSPVRRASAISRFQRESSGYRRFHGTSDPGGKPGSKFGEEHPATGRCSHAPIVVVLIPAVQQEALRRRSPGDRPDCPRRPRCGWYLPSDRDSLSDAGRPSCSASTAW